MNNTKIYILPFREEELNLKSLDYLNKEEKQKAKNFFHKKNEINYMLSHIYLRKILSKHYPKVLPREWKFKTNKYGKPYIAQKEYENIFFNISHTNRYFAMIISDKECGIDIEEENSIVINQNILDLVLTPKEQLLYKTKEVSFYTIWTLKEAYLKAIGKGLFIPLQDIEFLFIKNNKPFRKKDYICITKIIEPNIYLSYSQNSSFITN